MKSKKLYDNAQFLNNPWLPKDLHLMKDYLWGMEVQLLSFSSHLIVVVVPAAAAAFVAVAFVAAVFVAVVFVAETDVAAVSEDEFGAVETVVQPKECAWHDYYWDRTVALLQKKQSS